MGSTVIGLPARSLASRTNKNSHGKPRCNQKVAVDLRAAIITEVAERLHRSVAARRSAATKISNETAGRSGEESGFLDQNNPLYKAFALNRVFTLATM